jgi:hypothetical protein
MMFIISSFIAVSAHDIDKTTDGDRATLGSNEFGDGWTAVSSATDLNDVRNDLSGNYYLTDDIIFDGTAGNFIPIGSESNNFTGKLDGNRFTIKGVNVQMNGTSDQYAALFGFTDGAEISNLMVEDSSFSAVSLFDNAFAAGISAHSRGTIIKNCDVDASISAKGISRAYAGGITGYADTDVSINGCGNMGSVETSADDYAFSGGIIGYVAEGPAYIEKCRNEGSVLSTVNTYFSSYGIAGGIVGYSYKATLSIKECYNAGYVVSSSLYGTNAFAGGIAGYARTDTTLTIMNVYNTGHIMNMCGSTSSCIGGIAGFIGTYSGGSVLLANAYSNGVIEVDGQHPFMGGIAGHANGAEIINCYYLSGQLKWAGSYSDTMIAYSNVCTVDGGDVRGEQGSDAYGAADMMPSLKYAQDGLSIYCINNTSGVPGWDFHKIWMISESTGYPVFRPAPETEPSTDPDKKAGKGSSGEAVILIAALLLLFLSLLALLLQRRNGIEVEIIGDMETSGSQIRPTPWVRYKGSLQKPDEDYVYTYGENTAIGIGTVTVRFIGKNSKEVTVTFKIVAKE